ncbi:tyrosine-type recombinase/integrase [Streptomyces sp. V1I6]|uniref:tyrosine-type recombinase/integrase n=1 Tax=Streptomyces sp. V1I6 TaxID=3042273 RepID=UPI002785E815|nr:tyrosine-type recombinase/integrase [Streptomyces sp. V1I6]MDQ0842385.1 integrase/recombinase XerD [Streptomyces sp. V1I6]
MVHLPAVPQATFLQPAAKQQLTLRGTPPASSPTALLELLRQAGASPAVVEATSTWLARRKSEHSRTAYAKDASWWLAWCAASDTNPAAARALHADQYAARLQETQLSKATQARRLAAASSWYEYLVRAEVAERNPFAGMDRPSVSADDSSTSGLTPDQLGRLLNHARNHESARTYALLAVLATTAARVGSILTATVGALGHDEGHQVIRLNTKGDHIKRVVLVPLAVAALERYLAERGEADSDAPLFITSKGKPLDEPAVLRLVRRVAKAAGVPQGERLSPHSFRHSYATTLLSRGVALADVQDAMGHADPRTTRRYDRAAGALHRSPSYRMQDELTKAMDAQAGE